VNNNKNFDLLKMLLGNQYPNESPRTRTAPPSYLLDPESRAWVDSSWDEVKNNTARVVAPMPDVSTRYGSVFGSDAKGYRLIPMFDNGEMMSKIGAFKSYKDNGEPYPKSKSLLDILSKEHFLHENYLAPQAQVWTDNRRD
jgi:hypothetical protein